MGPGEAAALPGRPLAAGPGPWGPHHRGPRGGKDGLVHRVGVADVEGGDRVRVGPEMSGVPLLPQGRAEQHGRMEVRAGPGGADEDIGAAGAELQGGPEHPGCVCAAGAYGLPERPAGGF